MQWYYLDAQRQQIPADEASLGRLYSEGTIHGETLVWNETMTEWITLSKALPGLVTGLAAASKSANPPAASKPTATATRPSAAASPAPSGNLNPYSAPLAATSPSAPTLSGGPNVRAYAAILSQNAKWIRFLGVLMMIAGILYCLSIFGAVVGWVFIWLGLILNRIARLSAEVEASGSAQGFSETLESIGRYFKITGVLALIGLILTVIYIAGMIALLVLGAAGSLQEVQP